MNFFIDLREFGINVVLSKSGLIVECVGETTLLFRPMGTRNINDCYKIVFSEDYKCREYLDEVVCGYKRSMDPF